MTLRNKLSDWTDWDAASYVFGCEIGIFSGVEEWITVKSIFWSKNALGEGLLEALDALVKAGVVEHRSEPDDQYRWSRSVGEQIVKFVPM